MVDVDEIQNREAERQRLVEELRRLIGDYEEERWLGGEDKDLPRRISPGFILALLYLLAPLSKNPVSLAGLIPTTVSTGNATYRFVAKKMMPVVEAFAETPEEKGIILAKLMELSVGDFLRIFYSEMSRRDVGLG